MYAQRLLAHTSALMSRKEWMNSDYEIKETLSLLTSRRENLNKKLVNW